MARLRSLIDLKDFTQEQFEKLFMKAEQLKAAAKAGFGLTAPYRGEPLALLFFEPSTRTRMSFQSAAIRCGFGPLLLEAGSGTSLEKGESIEDSIYNVAAMDPRALIVRCGDKINLHQLSAKISMPVINAGWGIVGHPTQALLDAMTLKQSFVSLSKKRLLIVGDVQHSRVAASHFELMPKLEVEVAICGPKQFTVHGPEVKVFTDLDEALQWTDAVICLRVQFERHDKATNLLSEDYRKDFGLNVERLRGLKADGLILHPGPINHGIEMESEVLNDQRCRVMTQVNNGVYLREALLRSVLEGASL